ncbi:MAG: class I SAM-dependent methyltransferase [Pseudomonadota bacterium]
MQISNPDIGEIIDERGLYEDLLPLDNARILELGCGTGLHTRNIARAGVGRRVTAYEVDEIQHAKNLNSDYPHNIKFKFGGAENIHEPDDTFDVAMLFKSLHHVPTPHMEQALQEISRVLKPGGLVYISEPIFAGEFNEVLRLFHDEQVVRRSAFDCVKDVVKRGLFSLEQQTFFAAAVHFDDFADLDKKIIQATHTEHQLDEQTYRDVELAFNQHMTAKGANFRAPMRVDVLRK